MSEIYSTSPKNRTPRHVPVGDDRGSWGVNTKTKKMCWNQKLTTTNIRSNTVSPMSKRVEEGSGVGGGGEARR